MALPLLLLPALVVLLLPLALLLAVPLVLALVGRPWDGAPRRGYYAQLSETPLFVFRALTWFFWGLERLGELKPAPYRITEMASAYVQSQVLFAVSGLGVPDLLRAAGRPLTAAEVAMALGPKIRADWTERLLRAAAAFGIVKRLRGHYAPLPPDPLPSSADAADAAEAARWSALLPRVDAYTLNAATAVLCSDAPLGVAQFAALLRDNAEGIARLEEGLRTGRVPFTLTQPDGADFWARLARSPGHAVAFDAAMREKDGLGGAATAAAYPWAKFDSVIDVAGGNRQLLATLLARCPHLNGVLFDRAEQVARGQQWWVEQHATLLPRMAFEAGSMFEAAALPAPPPGDRRVAYCLSDVLHDWSDKECVAILRAIRTASGVPSAKVATGEPSPPAPHVTLLLLETMLSDTVLPCLARHRAISDITMLCNFGGGRERDEAAFSSILGAAGWRLRRVHPAAGLLCVLEAEPV